MTEWTKPSLYSTIVIVGALALLGFLAYTGKIALPDMFAADVVAVVLWLTQGARRVQNKGTTTVTIEPPTKRSGQSGSSDVPSMAIAAGAAVALGIAVAVLHGCRGAEVPQETAARIVRSTAQAVDVAADTCAAIALERRDLPLARRCRDHYDAARLFLIGTAEGVEAWDRAASSRESITCAVLAASDELGDLVAELEGAGVKVPELVAEARSITRTLGVCASPHARRSDASVPS